jgi:hypothetical protein
MFNAHHHGAQQFYTKDSYIIVVLNAYELLENLRLRKYIVDEIAHSNLKQLVDM